MLFPGFGKAADLTVLGTKHQDVGYVEGSFKLYIFIVEVLGKIISFIENLP
jgi:hypothetical protein